MFVTLNIVSIWPNNVHVEYYMLLSVLFGSFGILLFQWRSGYPFRSPLADRCRPGFLLRCSWITLTYDVSTVCHILSKYLSDHLTILIFTLIKLLKRPCNDRPILKQTRRAFMPWKIYTYSLHFIISEHDVYDTRSLLLPSQRHLVYFRTNIMWKTCWPLLVLVWVLCYLDIPSSRDDMKFKLWMRLFCC